MKQFRIILLVMVAALFASCGTTRTVPITGRKQNIMVSDEEILSLSNQEYSKYMKTAKLSTNASNTAMVKRVGTRLANAVENYLNTHNMAADAKQFSWEFNLVQDKSANAFCMPGGKIVVYEGLLPYTQNEAGLAIVLGHEIAHAVAKHSAEQMTKQIKQQYGTQIAGSILNSVVGGNVGSYAAAIAQQGFQFRNLKYSRDNESEADNMGLIFAAMAGYDPQVAIPFWQRMASGSGNQNDMFSDHPSDAKRIAALKKEMPVAMEYYRAATGSSAKTSQTSTSKNRKTTTKKTSSVQTVSASQLYKNTKKK